VGVVMKVSPEKVFRKWASKRDPQVRLLDLAREGDEQAFLELMRHIERREEYPEPKREKEEDFWNGIVLFSLDLEEDDLEEDLLSGDPERVQQGQEFYAQGFGAALRALQDDISDTLGLESIGLEVNDVDSEGGQINGISSLKLLGELNDRINQNVIGGDDYIGVYSPYFRVGNFMFFPRGFNGPRLDFTDWDDASDYALPRKMKEILWDLAEVYEHTLRGSQGVDENKWRWELWRDIHLRFADTTRFSLSDHESMAKRLLSLGLSRTARSLVEEWLQNIEYNKKDHPSSMYW